MKQNATDRQMEGEKMRNIVSTQIQFSVPISHAYHLLMRINFTRLPLYNFVDFTFSYSNLANSIIPNISPVIECSMIYIIFCLKVWTSLEFRHIDLLI